MASAPAKQETIYRMVMPEHTCPFRLKAKDLLRREGYAVEDHWLTTREEIDAFEAKYGVKTTPQTFAAGERVGGYDDLRPFFGTTVRHPNAVTYQPVIAVFARAVRGAEPRAGQIDVLVNNAGCGHEGALEESSMDDLQRQSAANVFGPVAMIKAVLPGMRDRRRGHIVNVTSMGGFITMPGISFYCGSKFALEGISEALGKEVAAFGIRVTALAPGQFRTDWAGCSMDRTERSIADYDAVMDPIRAARQAKSGCQSGDPPKAAATLLALVEAPNPPVRLFLGADALELVGRKLEDMTVEVDAWGTLSRSTSFAS